MSSKYFILFVLFTLLIFSCKKDPPAIDLTQSGYPNDIGKIILTRCATPGCHTKENKDGAGGISLETWSNLFAGGDDGAVVIPYRSGYSSLFIFINTHEDLGPMAEPVMPLNDTPLTRDEVIKIKEWIDKGAPDKNGFVKFSDDPKRKKIYVTNQGCDLVSVIDQETGLLMRYVDVGNSTAIESPHMIKVSADGLYWFVIFTSGNVIQKFRTSDDVLVAEINIGSGNWNTFSLTSDSKKAFVVDWSAEGRIAYVNFESSSVKYYQGATLFSYPHGSTISPDDKTLYVTAQQSNIIYKIDITDPMIPEVENVTIGAGALDPHEIAISPDGTKYFITCQKSNEVRVLNIFNDSLLAVIPTGTYPQEMAFSTGTGYLFVTCTEDEVTFPGNRGSVSVIDYKNLTEVKRINAGFQPHGIGVDDAGQKVYVANRNINVAGPAPHHTTSCAGRNGYLTAIDLNTLELLEYSPDVSVDPFSVAVRK